jgi:hypothetical protein
MYVSYTEKEIIDLSGQNDESQIAKLGIGFTKKNCCYVQDSLIDRFGKKEDIPLGWSMFSGISFSGDLNEKDPKAKVSPYAGLSLSINSLAGYIVLNLSEKSYSEYTQTQGSLTFMSILIRPLRSRFMLRLSETSTTNKSLDNRMYSGSDNFLRGYGVYEMTGNRMININMETRTFIPLEIWSVKASLITFLDGGSVYDKVSDSSIRWGAGAGIRFSSSKSTSGTIIRFEVAYAA